MVNAVFLWSFVGGKRTLGERPIQQIKGKRSRSQRQADQVFDTPALLFIQYFASKPQHIPILFPEKGIADQRRLPRAVDLFTVSLGGAFFDEVERKAVNKWISE